MWDNFLTDEDGGSIDKCWEYTPPPRNGHFKNKNVKLKFSTKEKESVIQLSADLSKSQKENEKKIGNRKTKNRKQQFLYS